MTATTLKQTNILITGASGSLGMQLVTELLRQGIRPIVHARENSDTSFVDGHDLEKRLADFSHDDDLGHLVAGVDYVIHSAAWVDFRRDPVDEFDRINTQGAVRLFEAARAAGVKRFVQVSSVGAIGAVRHRSAHRSELATEDNPYNLAPLRIPYLNTKRTAELKLREVAKGSPTELVIVNPAIIISPSRSGDDRGRVTRYFSGFILPDLSNRINLVDVRDVAVGVIAALRQGRPGERYILGGDNIEIRELVLYLSVILGKIPHLVNVPRRLVLALSRAALWYGKVGRHRKISFYPGIARMLDYDWVYTSKKARRELGYRSRALGRTLNDLLNNDFDRA
jgi:dihydroflavonol-4-reductase